MIIPMNEEAHPAASARADGPRHRAITCASRPEHFITHPAELRLFHAVSDATLRDFAHGHGWRVVRRVGGRQIEFYNDAGMRQERLRTGQTRTGDARFE